MSLSSLNISQDTRTLPRLSSGGVPVLPDERMPATCGAAKAEQPSVSGGYADNDWAGRRLVAASVVSTLHEAVLRIRIDIEDTIVVGAGLRSWVSKAKHSTIQRAELPCHTRLYLGCSASKCVTSTSCREVQGFRGLCATTLVQQLPLFLPTLLSCHHVLRYSDGRRC